MSYPPPAGPPSGKAEYTAPAPLYPASYQPQSRTPAPQVYPTPDYNPYSSHPASERPMQNAYAAPPTANTNANGYSGYGYQQQQSQGPFPPREQPTSQQQQYQQSQGPYPLMEQPSSQKQQSHTPNVYDQESAEQRQLDLEEEEMLKKGMVDWNALKKKETWFKKSYIKYYVILVIIIVLVALMIFKHDAIINWLKPVTNKLRTIKVGWLIPIAVLIVLSFPPLFGQEIVLVLIGLVWGLGEGIGIAAAGTIIGEVLNLIFFKFFLKKKSQALEHKSLNYACLVRVLRDGGILVCTVSRLSALPTHVTTAIYGFSGFALWKFVIAAVLSLPKQLIIVYVGVVYGQTNPSTSSKTIDDCVFAATAVVSVLAAWYIWWKMGKVRVSVWREQREYLREKGVPANGLPPDVDAMGKPIQTESPPV